MTSAGIGAEEALRLWRDVLGPACLSVDHRRYLSFIPSAPDEGGGRLRHARRRDVGVLRVPGWRARARCTPRTRPCAGWPTWPACRTRPVGRSSRAARSATCRRWSRPASRRGTGAGVAPGAVGGVRHRGDALVGEARAAHGHGRRRDRGARRRAGTPDRRRPAGDRRGAARGRARRDLRRRRHRRARRTSASSTTSPGSPRSPASTGGGCTSTAPTAVPGWPRRASATCSPASSTPTRSSSTRTSGCSRRSTPAR